MLPTCSFCSQWSHLKWTVLPEMTTSHEHLVHVSPSPICLALKYCHKEFLNSLVATLDAWRLENVQRRPRHNLDISSYDELLWEAIPQHTRKLESKWRHFFSPSKSGIAMAVPLAPALIHVWQGSLITCGNFVNLAEWIWGPSLLEIS